MKIIDVRLRPPFRPYLDKNGMFDTEATNPFAISIFYKNFGMNMSESMKTASMEKLFEEMDRAGEMTGVVSIRKNARGYENDALLDLLKTYPQYHISKNRIELSDKSMIDTILGEMKKIYASEDINDIDGVKISFESRKEWVHLRKSNTEPIIRIYAESSTAESADRLASEIKAMADRIMSR